VSRFAKIYVALAFRLSAVRGGVGPLACPRSEASRDEKPDSLKGMEQAISIVLLLTLIALFFQRSMLDSLIEAINNFHDNFRGGPPTPMHPSPANDGALLRRRTRKKSSLYTM
jgi:hypothetical protein